MLLLWAAFAQAAAPVAPSDAPAPSNAPAPAPSVSAPVGGQGPLRTIGRVRVTTPLCTELLGEASRAVAIETENDGRIDIAIRALRSSDFDSSPLAKNRGTRDLARRAVDLRSAAVEGRSEMQRFRAAAKSASTATGRAKFAAFADALDGALARQRALADTLGRFVAYLDAHDPITNDEHDASVFAAIAAQNSAQQERQAPFDPRAFGPTAGLPPQLSSAAKSASAELERRALPLTTDESDAADKIDPAFDGC